MKNGKSRKPDMWPQKRKIQTGLWFLGFRVNKSKMKTTEGVGRGKGQSSDPRPWTATEMWDQFLQVRFTIFMVGGDAWAPPLIEAGVMGLFCAERPGFLS